MSVHPALSRDLSSGYKGERYTLAISIYFPFHILATPIATVLVRKFGPRIFLPEVTVLWSGRHRVRFVQDLETASRSEGPSGNP